MAEINQAYGSNAAIIYAVETAWGELAASPAWRAVRMLAGTNFQANYALYASREIRSDRMSNNDVIGTQSPGWTLPFELSPQGPLPFIWHTLGGTPTHVGGPVDEVQSLVLSGGPTGGTFKLSFGGQVTGAINYNAAASAVDSALEALSTIGTGNVTCAGGPLPSTPVTITFASTLAGTNVPLIQVASNSLTGGTNPYVSVDVTTHGVGSAHHRHILKGSVALPTGFTLEQQHADIGQYFGFLGGRVDRMTLNFNINQPVTGAFDIMFREALDPSSSSLNGGSAPTLATEDPFTAVQIQLLEGSTLQQLAQINSASLSVANNLRGDRFVLGSNLRQNLKPGTRLTNGSLRAMFRNSDLLLKAKNATSTKLKFLCTSGPYSIEFYTPAVKVQPVGNTWPSVESDSAIDLNLGFKATKDSGISSDIQVTMVVPESDLTA